MAGPILRPTLQSITDTLLALVPDDVQQDLRTEDPAAALEVHYPPLRCRALPAGHFSGSDCSTDGYYETEVDDRRPWILYADDVRPERVRFTLLHELGHHLFATDGALLYDDLDRLAGSATGAVKAEEAACHRFAGHLLLPTAMVESVVGGSQLTPQHIVDLKDQSTASWEAVAVRAAEACDCKAAVALVRDPGFISFCAASSRLGWSWWARGSRVDPDGPLARALSQRARALPETYRFDQPFAERFYCDTLPVHDQLAVAVLCPKPSDGHFDILEDPEPAWRDRDDLCAWDNEERSEGWCDDCHGHFCRQCGRCGCSKPKANPVCSACDTRSPFRPGASVCMSCEADGLG